MARARFDPGLVAKIAEKVGIAEKSVREMATHRAGKLHVRSEAALVVWAQELGIGTRRYFNNLEADLQAQVRGAAPLASLQSAAGSSRRPKKGGEQSTKPAARRPLDERDVVKAATPFILSDSALRDRCKDLLIAKRNHDRALLVATVVLEARLRTVTGLSKKKAANAPDLITKAVHVDKGMLRVSDDRDEQEGFYYMVRGAFAVLRNPGHHTLNDDLPLIEALRLCGFVNYLLARIDAAEKVAPAL